RAGPRAPPVTIAIAVKGRSTQIGLEVIPTICQAAAREFGAHYQSRILQYRSVAELYVVRISSDRQRHDAMNPGEQAASPVARNVDKDDTGQGHHSEPM